MNPTLALQVIQSLLVRVPVSVAEQFAAEQALASLNALVQQEKARAEAAAKAEEETQRRLDEIRQAHGT